MSVKNKVGAAFLSATMAVTLMPSQMFVAVQAAQDTQGYTVLGAITNVEKNKNIVTITYEGGEKSRITFLAGNILRFNMEPTGDFKDFPVPNGADHEATIAVKNDKDWENTPDAIVTDAGGVIAISTNDGKAKLEINKATSIMRMIDTSRDNKVVWEEASPLKYKASGTIQTLKQNKDEYFYGGGVQNGRFSHKGTTLNIQAGGWDDGGAPAPVPYYWSTAGYGILRNTWKTGTYDFGTTNTDEVVTTHNERRFDSYMFVDDDPVTLINDYTDVTGKAVQLPDYAFYLGNLNCYNRDYWADSKQTWSTIDSNNKQQSSSSNGRAQQLDGTSYFERQPPKDSKTSEYLYGKTDAEEQETLNGDNPWDARGIITEHEENDIPMGWFLPNDGYGCGYGQTDSFEGDIDNLKDFTTYANAHGIQSGLWTQSNLWPKNPDNPVKGDRDVEAEVNIGGIRSMKTDVAWVGPGYSFALNGISVAYDAIANSGDRPNIVTLMGWGGTQRYGGIWTGDQKGGLWEYIRFHIPTYIGAGLTGQPNMSSDMDGIYAGGSSIITTRDYQWKAFTPVMLDMDGWGSKQKFPYADNTDATSINRAYLKLKAEMMPYISSMAYEASTTSEPMVRAMMLDYPDEVTMGKTTQYQYMWGDNLLVAPIYQDTASDSDGNDIRDGIYLPDADQVWIDYFTGKQYRGGNMINNFDAPLWKLPLFVKNGAIIPMYPENNNPEAITETNPKGLDKTQRIVEFWPSEKETNYVQYENDGITIDSGNITTEFTSVVKDSKATLTAKKSTGGYDGADTNRTTEFVVNASARPTGITGSVAGSGATFTEVSSREDYEKATGNVWFYDEHPESVINKYANEDSKYGNGTETIATTPKIFVKTGTKNDIKGDDYQVVIAGYVNDGNLPEVSENKDLSAPVNLATTEVTASKINFSWDSVVGATSYDVEVDGVIYTLNPKNSYSHLGLNYLEDHSYRVRAVNALGHSAWSDKLDIKTADDPYRNVPKDLTVSFDGNNEPGAYAGKLADMVDGVDTTEYSSAASGAWKNQAFIVDMQKSFAIDKIDYVFRSDGSNGSVLKFDLSYSIDGKNWISYGDLNVASSRDDLINKWPLGDVNAGQNAGARYAELPLDNPIQARYLKLKVLDSSGGFLQAYEIRPYHVDGDKGRVVGDLDGNGVVDDADKLAIDQHHPLAVGSRPGEKEYDDFAKANDINLNGVFDSVDYAALLTQLNGGVKTLADVSGNMTVVPSKTNVKAGETFTMDVYGSGMKNVYALDFELPFEKGSVDLTTALIDKGTKTGRMTLYKASHSNVDVGLEENVDTVFAVLSNVGEASLLNGDTKVATVTLKANKDINLAQYSASFGQLTGSNLSSVNAFTVTKPQIPEGEKILTMEDMNITSQADNPLQANMGVDKLVDGIVGSDAGRFEFKWGANQETVVAKLPHELRYDFNSPQTLNKLRIQVRDDSGKLNTGALKEFDLTGITADGTEEAIGSYTINAKDMTFDLGNKTYKSVILNAKSSQGGLAYKLNIDETSFIVKQGTPATGIEFAEDNSKELYLGRLTPFKANVLPSDATNKFYSMESDNEDVVRVLQSSSKDGYNYTLLGMKAGKANITVKSLESDAITKTVEVEVLADTFTADLESAINDAEAIHTNLYTIVSAKDLEAKLTLAKEALKGSQDDIDKAEMALRSSIASLEFKGSDNSRPDSTSQIDEAGMTVVSATNYADSDYKENIIDNDINTIWHSSYQSSAKLPVDVVVDLGDTYDLEQVNYLPRQSRANGHITHYRIEVSLDNKTYTPVVEGYLPNDGSSLEDPSLYKKIKFEPVEAKYVKFIALETLGDTKNKYASIAELDFFAEDGGQSEDTTLAKEILGSAIKKYESISQEDKEKLAPKVQAMLKEAYDAAVVVMNDKTATNEQCYEAWADLANALHYADFKADTTELKAMIDYCNGLEADNYSAGFEAMLKALEAAQGVYDDENALQARIDKAYSDLLNAKNALVANGDTSKKDLADLVAMFDEIDATKYCDNAAWTAFVKAMDDAKAVLANNDAAPSQISTAMLALTSAYEDIRLLPSEDALNDLKAFITKVEALNLSAYGAENTARFMTALGNARTMVNDPNTYDPAIFSEIKAINDIIDNGETVVPEAPTTGADDPAAPEENVTPAPEKPAAPDTSVNGTTKPGTTKTGDTTNAMGLGAMFLASAGAFLGLKKRKKNSK